jgi:hypothetical protein
VQSNRRSGRRRRVRRLYRFDIALATVAQLQGVQANIACMHRVDADGCMHRDNLYNALVDQECLALPPRTAKTKPRQSRTPGQHRVPTSVLDKKAAHAAALKETFSTVYQVANAAGVARVMAVLEKLREAGRRQHEADGIDWRASEADVQAEREQHQQHAHEKVSLLKNVTVATFITSTDARARHSSAAGSQPRVYVR